MTQSPKDWVDYFKFAADLGGPIVAAIFGLVVLRVTKRMEHSQWRNQKLIEKRIAVWDEVAGPLNDIYSYCKRVGAWKELSPIQVIGLKRQVDRKFHINGSYFSPEMFSCFMNFMSVCFCTYRGHGKDAQIKSPLSAYKSVHPSWQQAWNTCFDDSPSTEKQIKDAYLALQRRLFLEMGGER